ncbi:MULTISPECIES: TraC family protein [Enterobacterales]|uniref:TraC family protein n=1 Tax=Kluyvera cryocrescens TaxID=580 RepID=A0AAW9C704_KLUCR|nr:MULTISPECIES: TraC family protein [Enterobacterales]EFE7907119.1 TraC family protein [Escherichia coli]HBS2746751.1 TraC family protein [Klebsiella quasipneumoniae subsp. quasipneumoniae]HCI9488387.1 TraC family protein [Raoultella ornithinolytica]EFM2410582.1 TraC family protein [Escherichia coli]EJU32615.1 F pilus assembly Type-IV secretion system for plasmid transfer [Klebsiella sp. OBRC7]
MNNSRLAKELERLNLGNFIPVVDRMVDVPYFLLEENAVGMFFICNPSPGLYDNQQNLMTDLFKMDFPAESIMQMSLVALPDINTSLSRWLRRRGNRMGGRDNEKADLLTVYSLDYLSKSQYDPLKVADGVKITHADDLKLRNFELWITVRIPINSFVPNESESIRLDAIYKDLLAKLKGLSLSPVTGDADMWLYSVDKVINPGKDARWKYGGLESNSLQPLNQQVNVPGRKFEVGEDYFASLTADGEETAQRYFKHLSMTKFPEYVNFGAIYELVVDWMTGSKTIFSPFIINFCIQFPYQKKIQKEYLRYKAITDNQSKIPIVLKYLPRLADMDKDYSALTRELEDKAKLLRTYMTFIVMDNTLDRVKVAAKSLISYYSEKKITVVDDSYICFSGVMSALPLCNDPATFRDMDRGDVMTNTGAAHLAPIFGPWKGNTQNPVIPFVTREGQLVMIDIFETSASYNVCVGATSGAGKSFAANNIILNYLCSGEHINPLYHFDDIREQLTNDKFSPPLDLRGKFNASADGAQVFVVDIGRSYQGLAEQFEDSQFIDFGVDATFSLNPFAFMVKKYSAEVSLDGVTGKSEDSNKESDLISQTIMVLNQIKLMASSSGNISDYQEAEMLRLIIEEAQKPEDDYLPSVTGFAKKCKNHDKQEIKDIGVQLGPWCEGGIYGRRFTTSLPPIDFDSRFIVLELEELKPTPHLQWVVLMSIIQAAQHAMFIKKDGRRRLFILDEAWEYIGESNGDDAAVSFFTKFLEAAWRRFRKTNCAGICITQSFEDFYKSPIGIAIANNSPWKFIMKQSPEAIDSMQKNKYISATASEYERMKLIRTEKFVFSEIMIRFENVQQIVRLYVDRKMELCFTTDPADRRKIWSLIEDGFTYAEAIDRVYEQEQIQLGLSKKLVA